MRLFIAILLEERIKNELCRIMEDMRPRMRRANFTRRENLHLTLVFLGETDRTDSIEQVMGRTEADAFPLKLDRLGKFNRGGGDIYWMGIGENPALSALHADLSAALRRVGFTLEDRRFSPHLTLAREAVPGESFDEKAFSQKVPQLSMPVSGFSLMKSERIGGRLVYTEIYKKPLRVV
jgi:2'-5' RNA ligase